MKSFGSYRIFPQEKLIVEYHSGDINIDQFTASRKIILQDIDYNPNFTLIFDFRDTNMIVDHKDIKQFIEYFKSFSEIIGERKSAYLTKTPKQVMVSTLFSMNIKNLSIKSKTFSTIKSLLRWVEMPKLNKSRFIKIVSDIKKSENKFYLAD